MHTLGTPVVAYGPRSTTADGPIDLVAPAPYRSVQVRCVNSFVYYNFNSLSDPFLFIW